MAGLVIFDPNWRDMITPKLIVANLLFLAFVLGVGWSVVRIVELRWWFAVREIKRNARRWKQAHGGL